MGWKRETGNAVTKEQHDERADAEAAKKAAREKAEAEQRQKELQERNEYLRGLEEENTKTDPKKNGTIGERHSSLEKNSQWHQPENPMETLKRHNKKSIHDRLREAKADEKTWMKR